MKRFKNILCVMEEGAADQSAAVGRAVALAESNQAQLALLCVAEKPRLGPFRGTLQVNEYEARIRKREMARMERLFEPYEGQVPVTLDVRFGTAFIEVVRDVLGSGRDLVIKSSGGGGIHSFLFGGTDYHLLRKCPCPVWILRPQERPQYKRIMAAVDFDPWDEDATGGDPNRLILELASSLAISDSAELHIAHAWESVTENMIRVFGSELSESAAATNIDREQRDHGVRLEQLSGNLRRWIGKDGYDYLSPRLHLRRGNARNVIPALAGELKVDLVVMGTVGRTGIPGLIIGNTAEVILNNIACGVLAVKPAGFLSPVQLSSR